MKKKFLSMVLCLCMVVGMLPAIILPAAAVGQYGVNLDNSAYQNKYAKPQCTWYCWGRAMEKCGVDLTFGGNAQDWYNNAANTGFPVGTAPRANSIAVFRGVGSETVNYGHVVFVEKIEGTTAYCTEGNYIYSPEYHETTFDTNAGVFYPGDSKWEQRLIGYIYLDDASSSQPLTPSVSFSKWENSNYTYIRETDASIGQEINVSNGNCTETGMYLYDANGRKLASAKNPSYELARVYFKINEECGYTLTPGTTYKYKFYAVVNGQTYWGNMGSFQTLPSSTSSQPSNPSDNLPADTSIEAEPNDTLNSANSISVNQEMAGNIRNTSDKDWFVFQVPNDGFISITFSHDFVDSSSAYWRTTLYTSANKELDYWTWKGNATSAGTSSKIGVPAGTYYLCVSHQMHSSNTYRFTVNYTPSDSWEKEFNETITTANQISTDTETSGSIRNTSDKDWYVFQVPNDGFISVTFSHDFVDSSSAYWRTTLYTSANKELDYWTWRGNATSAGAGSKIGVPAGTYYLCVSHQMHSSNTYRFTVNYTPSDSWEKEFNETITTANQISTGTETSGSIRNTSDKDWFVFQVPNDGFISVTFSHDFVDSSSAYWRTTLYTSENKELDYWTWKGNATSAGTGSKIGVPAGTYYLCVSHQMHSSQTYRFTVNLDRGGDTQKPVPANGITLSRSSMSLTVGGSSTLTATVQPSNATDKTVQWHSSNTKVAIVQDGKVTAMGAGNTVITASCGDVSATCTVTVSTKVVPASGITLNRSSLSLSAGSSAMLTAAIMPSDATDTTVVWRSENTSVATVVDGKVTAVKEGSTKITASCGGFTATCLVSVTAKESQIQPSDVHFERVNIYFQDQFTDVPANQWYTNYVAEVFELGLMKGNSKTTFNPYGDVKISEAITMAARIHSIFTKGYEDFQPTGGQWYQPYLDYAYENGIINLAYYNCDVTQKASRAQFAEIFANSMPAEGLTAINDVADGAIPDVNMGNRYAKFIYMLYRAGILAGSDANGTFNPSTYITRAEAATVVSRMAESNNRISITLR